MSKPPEKQLPELVLDKKPVPAAKERRRTLPPFSGLLIVVVAVILLAVGYGIYRDGHPQAVEGESIPPPANSSGANPGR